MRKEHPASLLKPTMAQSFANAVEHRGRAFKILSHGAFSQFGLY